MRGSGREEREERGPTPRALTPRRRHQPRYSEEQKRKANLVRSKYEHAMHTETNSLFGLAIINGLGGAAATLNRSRITARQLHAYAKEYLNQELSGP